MSFARRLFALSVFSLVVALFNARQVNAFALDVGFNKTECVFKVRFLLLFLLLMLMMMCLCARLFPGEREIEILGENHLSLLLAREHTNALSFLRVYNRR